MAYIVDLWTKKNPDKSPGAPKKVPSARWGVGKRWQVRWQEAGEWTSESFVTQDAAELHRSRVEVGQDEGTWITKEKKAITFGDLWEPLYASKAGISEKTRRDYLSVWQTHVEPTWGGEACASVQRSTVTAWIATLVNTKTAKDGQEPRPLGDAQKYKVGVVMRGLMDLAKERGAVASNPLEKAVAKKPGPSERRYLKVHEVDALMDAAPTDAARLLLRVLVMTGLRPGEAKALKVKDLDYDRALDDSPRRGRPGAPGPDQDAQAPRRAHRWVAAARAHGRGRGQGPRGVAGARRAWPRVDHVALEDRLVQHAAVHGNRGTGYLRAAAHRGVPGHRRGRRREDGPAHAWPRLGGYDPGYLRAPVGGRPGRDSRRHRVEDGRGARVQDDKRADERRLGGRAPALDVPRRVARRAHT